MLDRWLILLTSLAYLVSLFAIAWWGDRRAEQGRSVIRHPGVYTLSIAVYCTSWTFYGAVGSAARSGPEYLAIYLGPTLVFLGWWLVLRKIVRIGKVHRITSIADFIASRYGKSSGLAVLVTLVAVAFVMPYIALQLKAVATSWTVLSAYDTISAAPLEVTAPTAIFADTAFWVAAGMAVFSILFGTRHIDASEHHEGVVAAIAFESLVKLLAFVAVGAFAVWGVFDGFGDMFAAAAALPQAVDLFTFAAPDAPARWVTITLLSMCAILCLPRQFQVMVVENVDERHLGTASWLFPVYLLILSVFVVPIALAGLMVLPTWADADSFVLTVPLTQGQDWLALLAFIGGLSSATGMVIVACIGLSTMVCNDLVMPLLLRSKRLGLSEQGDLTGFLLFVRRASIVGLLLLGYVTYRLTGQSGALASIGLISFAGAAQFAPAILGGLFWRRGTRRGAKVGLLLGFLTWVYTLLLPSFARSGWLDIAFVRQGPWDIAALKPEALLGLTGMDPLTHALFWSMLANLGAYVVVSVFSRQDALERIQATLFVDIFRRPDAEEPQVWRRTATVSDLYALVQRFLGRAAAHRAFRDYGERRGLNVRSMRDAEPELVHLTERLLAGSIGAASARVMVASVAKGEAVGLDQVMKILEETSQVIEYSQRLEQKSAELERTTAELREANRRLKELDRLKDDFLSTVSHELRTPLTSIRSFSEILADNPDLERGQVDRFLGIIIRESERLTRLIDQILDLARLEAGHGEWTMAVIDPDEALDDALAVTSSLFADKGVTIDRRTSTMTTPVFADRDRLMQVLVNLLSNAVKFCPRTGGAVTVRSWSREDGWRVAITDNGPGVPAAERERIFDKFVQASQGLGDRPSGTGLGLAISRQIVEFFGGTIWVDPAPGGGAAFCLDLPRAAPATAPATEVAE